MKRALLLVAVSVLLGCGTNLPLTQSHAGRFDTKMNMAAQLFAQKDYDGARREYTSALEAAEQASDPSMTSKALLSLAFVCASYGKSTDAFDYAKKALEQVDKLDPKDDFLRAAVLLQLGKAQQVRGDFKSSENSLKEAEKLFNGQTDALGEQYESAFALGITYENMARYKDAIACFLRALETERKRIKLGDESPLVAAVYAEVGRCHIEEGNLEKASDYLELATKIHRSRRLIDKGMAKDTSLDEAWIAVNAARLMDLRGMNVNTLPMYTEAEKNFEANMPQPSPQLIMIHREQGRTLLNKGKITEAEVALKKSLLACHEFYGATHPELGKTLDIYSKLMEVTNRPDEAKRMSGTAKEILTALSNVDKTKETAKAN